MDVVPLPDGLIAHDPVPDLGDPDFDNQGFEGYSERQGWNVGALKKGEIHSARGDWTAYVRDGVKHVPLEDIPKIVEDLIQRPLGAFIQTWILFGIFQEALQRPVFRHEVSTVTTRYFEGRATSTRQITVKRLFTEFRGKLRDQKTDLDWINRLSGYLNEAARVLNILDGMYNVSGVDEWYVMPAQVHLALSTMVEILFHHIWSSCPPQSNEQDAMKLNSKRLEKNLIVRHRWCPHMVRRIHVQMGLEALYYATLIPNFGKGQHEKCKENLCVASNIEPNRYRVRHIVKDCSCRATACDHDRPKCSCNHEIMPVGEYLTSFDDGGFPLVQFKEERIDIVKYSPGIRYVAISHVWADGRGDPKQNALPVCQLRSIHRYAADLSKHDEVIFWMDTLCVPIHEPLRNTTVMRMAQVYSSATQVLVLSEDLLFNEVPSTYDQIGFMILCSKWNSRLWTMQEAALASDLYFQFADRYVKFSDMQVESLNAFFDDSEVFRSIGLAATNLLFVVQDAVRSIRSEEEISIARLCYGIRYRSTSRPSDTAICGSILLGSDLGPVLAAPDEKKLQVFWSCPKSVPTSILWVHGPREKTDGARWVPSDLLQPLSGILPPKPSDPRAQVCRDGLIVHGGETVRFDNFNLPTNEDTVFIFSLPESHEKYFFAKELEVENETWRELRDVWNGCAVLILPQMPGASMRQVSALVMPTVASYSSPETAEASGPIPARYLAQVAVFAQGGRYDHVYLQQVDEEQSDLRYKDNDDVEILVAQRVDPSTRWCIL